MRNLGECCEGLRSSLAGIGQVKLLLDVRSFRVDDNGSVRRCSAIHRKFVDSGGLQIVGFAWIRSTMRFSLLNLMALTAFSAWVVFIFRLPIGIRGSWVFGSTLSVIAVSLLLGLASPAGEGRLAVEKNEFYVVFIAFAKFVVIFSIGVVAAKIILPFFGIDMRYW